MQTEHWDAQLRWVAPLIPPRLLQLYFTQQIAIVVLDYAFPRSNYNGNVNNTTIQMRSIHLFMYLPIQLTTKQ